MREREREGGSCQSRNLAQENRNDMSSYLVLMTCTKGLPWNKSSSSCSSCFVGIVVDVVVDDVVVAFAIFVAFVVVKVVKVVDDMVAFIVLLLLLVLLLVWWIRLSFTANKTLLLLLLVGWSSSKRLAAWTLWWWLWGNVSLSVTHRERMETSVAFKRKTYLQQGETNILPVVVVVVVSFEPKRSIPLANHNNMKVCIV